ncbi:MAG TPA: sulfatase-like hydrolase/transferase [Polyangiaceae bacterium]|nr:sulfatase-like hydrolase/transferase [Polyangiaceae bacterium]
MSGASGCELHHRGLIIDFADESTESEHGFTFGTPPELVRVERAGAQLRALDASSRTLDFWWWKTTARLELSALVRAETSERITFSVDGRVIGTARTKPGETGQVVLPLRDFALTRGRHRLTVAVPKGRRGGGAVEVAWARLGDEAQQAGSDQPMSRADAWTEVTIADSRRRAVVLREGGAFFCPLWLANPTKLRAAVGLWGQGAAEAELWAQRADGSEQLLQSIRLTREDAPAWRPLEVDLSAYTDDFVGLWWRVPRIASGARLALAEPALVEPPVATSQVPHARQVLWILLAGLRTSDSPPHAAESGLPFLQRLAAEATRFPNYRGTTSSAQAAVVSLLSGAPPWEHGMGEQDRSWPRGIPRLAERIEAASGQTAFFTGVPHDFEPFGLARGFEVFEQISPVADVSAIEPTRRLGSWLRSRLGSPQPILGIVHLRGGHPPFDVNHEQAQELPPAEYGGDLDPRRAAIQLLSIRSRTRPAARIMPDEDWVRLDALRRRALLDQSASLETLLHELREKGAWDDSLIIVMGDVGTQARPDIPFDEQAPLNEATLSVPLFVKFPGKHLAGRPVPGTFSPRDVFATVSLALGLESPGNAIDLGASTAEHDARARAHVAFRKGLYSTRLGPYLLTGQSGRAPRLCRIDLDPSCSVDRYAEEPLPSRVLWLATYAALRNSDRAVAADTLPENEELKAALTVWGVTR